LVVEAPHHHLCNLLADMDGTILAPSYAMVVLATLDVL
jgi:hypothetical protein